MSLTKKIKTAESSGRRACRKPIQREIQSLIIEELANSGIPADDIAERKEIRDAAIMAFCKRLQEVL